MSRLIASLSMLLITGSSALAADESSSTALLSPVMVMAAANLADAQQTAIV